MSLVILIGLPGAGKTTVGRHLARRLSFSFVDSDQVIEERMGCSIRTYFEECGESAFRDIETEVIDALTTRVGKSADDAQGIAAPAGTPRGCVLATGGGAVLRPLNRQRMRQRGTVIYLWACPEDLIRRLRHDTKRPLMQVADPMQRLRDLYAQRDPLYRETAHYTMETGRPSPQGLVHMISSQLELAGT